MTLDCFFVERLALPAGDRDGALRAVAETGAETVTVGVADQARGAIDDLDRAFGAGSDAVPAAVAQFLVNLHDVSYCHVQLLLPLLVLLNLRFP
jgi:hypothetical protein